MFENLKKVAPVGGVLIIFFSAVKHIIFYQAFNIDIIYYLTISEFIILLLNDIIIFSVGGILIALIVTGPFTKIGRKKVDKSITAPIKKPLEWLLITVTLLSLASFLMFNLDLTDYFKAKFSLVVLIIYLVYFLYITSQEVTTTFLYFLLVSFSVVLMTSSAYNNVLRLKSEDKEKTLEYTFISEDEKIVTGDGNVFIGKTEKYIFLYSKPSKKTRVLKTDDMREISIRELK